MSACDTPTRAFGFWCANYVTLLVYFPGETGAPVTVVVNFVRGQVGKIGQAYI